MTNLIDVARQFGTEEACLAYLTEARWPGGVCCLKCGSLDVSKTVSTVKARRGPKKGKVIKTRHLYDCLERKCGYQFSATTGTVFHDSHLPLATWFMAIALMLSRKGISALQLQSHLGIGSYRTAWHLNHRIRKAMDQGGDIMTGTVEMDETFIGGKFDKRRQRSRFDKQAVVGMIERPKDGRSHTRVRAIPIPKSNGAVVGAVVRANISDDAKLYTDESATYKTLDKDYLRYTVNHIQGEYVRGDVHTNSIEGFWSLFNRGLVGQFHGVSIKHLFRYLNEFGFRFNNRGVADLFAVTVREMVRTIQLPYKELISE